MANSLLSLEKTVIIARLLLVNWTEGNPAEFQLRRHVLQGQFATVYGLSAHTHRLAEAALHLYKADLQLEALPTIRCAYEHAINAMWVAQYKDAALALLNEGQRQRRNMLASAEAAGWASAVELANRVNDQASIESPLDDVAGRFHRVCKKLSPGGDEAYAIYRLMCAMSHPGPHLVDHYIDNNPPTVRRLPQPLESPEMWTFLLCCSLVWAGRAVDMLDKAKRRRTELRRVAELLGIEPELRPTDVDEMRRRREAAARRAGTGRRPHAPRERLRLHRTQRRAPPAGRRLDQEWKV